jgi:uracil-DNA glycosylase family 4
LTPASTFAHDANVLNGGDHRFRDTIASALGWWADAGVDTPIAETPHDWLAPPAKPAPATAPIATTSPVAALPDDLAAFHALLAEGAYVPGAGLPRLRVGPSGDPASGLMIVVDMPDSDDVRGGPLFSGATARLFDAILAAMGRTRETIYCAPLSPVRLHGGRIDAPEPLAALMRRHIALIRPRAVMLFGDETCRALLGMERGQARGGLRSLNHDGGTVPAIAIVHPRHMLKHPVCKAEAWADMRLLIGEFAS